ncbi:APC family permease [Alicyclobacillus dauci]|uniref:APC family permease n=1 Tax=Alicyclobacillus dauci TaxID=1475485 RepID=A0ABY6Z173_9BACL|nr:APC family permease [Alicyclobacillus dauci]WAH36474.1 APC family permease [Alicyclobacillus dauci]
MEENLKRVLKTPEVLFIGINGVVGGGIFLLPGQIAKLAGPNALWAYLVAGIIAILIGLAFAEASSMFSQTGGAYVYAEAAMGRTVAFTVGWMGWLTYVAGWGALSNGLVSYLSSLFPAVAAYRNLVIIVVIALLCLLNTYGVRKGSGTVLFFSVVKLIPLFLLIIVGLIHSGGTHSLGFAGGSSNFGQAVLVLIFAYGGFEMATIPAGEMVNPRKTISTAVIGTLIGVTLFYMLIQLAATRLDPGIATAKAPLAAAGSFMFAGGLTVMTVGAVLSIIGTQSGVALSSPRQLYALSRDRLLPGVLGKVYDKYQTPVVAIWTTGILVMIFATTGTFTTLILLNVAARLYEYLAVCVSVVILRYKSKGAERPFKLPFGIAIPAVAAILCIWLLAQETPQQLLAALVALVIGLILYTITARTSNRGRRTSG